MTKFQVPCELACKFCGKILYTTCTYTLHVNRCHSNPESEWYKKYHAMIQCASCGREFESLGRKFCSPECSHRRSMTDDVKNKIKSTIRQTLGSVDKYCGDCGCPISNRSATKFCRKCFGKHAYDGEAGDERKMRQSNTMKLKIASGEVHRWNIRRNAVSYAERFFMKVLDNNGIKYVHEYQVPQSNGYNFYCDFMIIKNGVKIDLEIDGSQHLSDDRKRADDRKSEYLSSIGYCVYRILWNNINTDVGKQKMKDKITQFLDYYNSL